MLTSGKSTTKAFIFSPYRKLAKLSPNRLRLSCMSCKCIRFASRSAIESLSSANCGSRCSKPVGIVSFGSAVDARKEEREEARRGVVGRDMGERERVREGCRDVGRGWAMFGELQDVRNEADVRSTVDMQVRKRSRRVVLSQ
jgi:hypothetical protein